jgi:site-specific DNA-methyltransferase (adenine-specific)
VNPLPRNTILTGDARAVLANLPPESIDCCVTSPPYVAGLRDYGHSDQLGQELTVSAYVAGLRAVLREVRRLLKPTGALWLNLGDAYAQHPRLGVPRGSLCLAPQRIALALAADDWTIRNLAIWHKPNPLPQSAHDRLSPTYETIIFATKQRRYFFDLDAIRVPHRSASGIGRPRSGQGRYQGNNTGLCKLKATGQVGNPRGKNPGDVWTVATAVDRLGHQATFPEPLIERPILATCPERICVQCDRPWMRPTRIVRRSTNEGVLHLRRVGALQRCSCFAPSSRPGVVLDPFFGTGTVGSVAARLGRDWLGVELNPAYVALARTRLASREEAA